MKMPKKESVSAVLTHDIERGWTAGRGALRVDCLALVVPP